MLPTLFNKMGSVFTDPDAKRASSTESDSVLSTITVEVPSSHAPSSLSTSSTPPTSIGDSASVSSTSLTPENTSTALNSVPARRTRRSSAYSYKYKESGSANLRASKKQKRDNEHGNTEARRTTIAGGELAAMTASNDSILASSQDNAGDPLEGGICRTIPDRAVSASPQPKRQSALRHSPRKTGKKESIERRKSTRLLGESVGNLTKQLTVLGKRSRKSVDGLSKVSRELKRLADTKEYAHIDTQPVVHEVWSNGKLVVPETANKKRKIEQDAASSKPKPVEEQPEPEKKVVTGPRHKLWLSKGLYAGQEATSEAYSGQGSKGKGAKKSISTYKPNKVLPMPMWNGQRLLEVGRDFKLPFDVCSPLPPGQPKPDEWRKTTRSE